ncbi:1-deoxy-D-xylulose-5-phosphate reductoisomerase [Ferroacidibacillus organovorans]|uniref:1-deoxy-D-xylulose 5-phosphate reductoisomerase n=1 Tax=Ferroacidibacillus organovorans TaxID=1765683 RepID=A0A101XP62_9BACL|nr:1-deoxy-D-xylulose-5-phosphate reductoisomerase [Ferroacidibacillus organovorans]KUO95042.1 1-deoxy-D-xylulose 5-phosphate reductoisomerase [Ferroacidibacillus organovorans]
MSKALILLGCTGSIGSQTLDVVRANRDAFHVAGVSARRLSERFLATIQEVKPAAVALESDADAVRLADQFPDLTVFSGPTALQQLAAYDQSAVVVNALSGSIGIEPTLAALSNGCDVALANKETLVAAGPLVMETARLRGANVIPVDSEHVALAQCLSGSALQTVEKLLITASGGPFRGKTPAELRDVTVDQALAHPNWSMGSKITVDSATLMNKGLEILEAHHLFQIPLEQIEAVIHPQSIVHSMVQFCDGSIMAQLGAHDMRIPIHYALFYKHGRKDSQLPRVNLLEIGQLTFEPLDHETFPAVTLAVQCGKMGGTIPAVMNAANEVAAHAFLRGELAYLKIIDMVAAVVESHTPIYRPTLEQILDADRFAREETEKRIRKQVGMH